MNAPKTRIDGDTFTLNGHIKTTIDPNEDQADWRDKMLETHSAGNDMLKGSSDETSHHELIHRALSNVIDDLAEEKTKAIDTQRAVGNILEDVFEERRQFEQNQEAMINILEDVDHERARAEAAIIELGKSLAQVRKAKEEVENANLELEAFSYSVAHDLRSPLRAMDGFSQELLESYSDKLDEQGREYLKRVQAAAQRMGLLIDDLLMLSRVSGTEMRNEVVSLTSLAHRAKERLHSADPQRKFQFIVAEHLNVRGDPGLLEIVLENLISNAWKFTRPRTRALIEVGLNKTKADDVYYVRDNGVGFDLKYVSKLFRAFQRLHCDSDFEGTGIGLAIVARIIRRHEGRIWVDAEVDGGATFYFTIGGIT